MKKKLFNGDSNLQVFLKVIIVICLFSIIYCIIFPVEEDSFYSTTSGSEIYPSGEIKKDDVYKQNVDCKLKNIKTIAIKFSTYATNNTNGSLNVSIYNINTKKNISKVLDLKDIKDNLDHIITFDDNICSNNEKIEITIKYLNYNKNNKLTLWEKTSDVKNKYQLNNIENNKELNINLYGKKKDMTIIWFPLMIMSICLLIYSVSGEKNEK